MIKHAKKIDSEKALAASKRALEFWASIDGNKLAKVGLKEKEMDILGKKREQSAIKFA
ncbi:hypothetical protein P0E69_22245 (plasmid) [Chimaeribacter arupi]|uniref:hypothetical protein n=1 Tax=Yersiniaceae TaxID=1903411 RepID=UPI0013FD0671|nr:MULTISPECIES: hypothetical protein [Yersiniaceae]MDV5140161.1 hypothetical protein [Chimaeribacter arupi]WKZ94928.1 hypothetical protein P0E69_22245 [Chimaeribacter arupi]